MGHYNEVCMGLDVVTWEKDAARTEEIMRKLIENMGSVSNFAESELYRHLTLKQSVYSLNQRMKANLNCSMTVELFKYMR